MENYKKAFIIANLQIARDKLMSAQNMITVAGECGFLDQRSVLKLADTSVMADIGLIDQILKYTLDNKERR